MRSDATDEMLMIRYQRGDRQSFAELIGRHGPRVYNFALRQLRDESLAQGVTQATFLHLVQNAAQFKNEARFSTWLYAIVRRLCVAHERRRSDEPERSPDQAAPDSRSVARAPSSVLTSLAPDGALERSVVSSQVGASIVRVLDDLPDDQREVFLMREVANLPFEDIASITESALETVKTRMRYALDRLRDALSNFEEYTRALR